MSKYTIFDNDKQKRYKTNTRLSKVKSSEFIKIKEINITDFISCIPYILKGKDIRDLIDRAYLAYSTQKPILFGIGGHVIKTGLSPLFIEMMKLGAIQGICCNGSVVIHDFEIACFQGTSEDVADAIEDGSFGMASDTCDTINEIIKNASREGLGYGEAIGKSFCERDDILNSRKTNSNNEWWDNANFELSILKNAYELNIPVTVHIGIGTDIVHQHKSADGKAIGDCSLRDFKILTHLVSQLDNGGLFVNFGSAVIIPEVFLKALSVARNNNKSVKNFTTAVFDMNYQYRPYTNITERPVKNNGKGYYFIGHHEIMIPLFLLALKEKIIKNGG